jgi:hypothetical protein
MLLLDAQGLRPGVAALKNYSAHDERDEPVRESGLPTHRRTNLYPDRSLSPATAVETEDEQGRAVKPLMHGYSGFRSQRPPADLIQTEIIAFGHLHDHLLAMRIGPRSLYQIRLAPVSVDYRDATIQSANVYFEFQSIGFVDSAPQPSPFEAGYSSTLDGEYVTGAAVAFTPNDDFGRTQKIALEHLASRFK